MLCKVKRKLINKHIWQCHPFKKGYRGPDGDCDFSSMTFVIVTIRKMKASTTFPKVLKGKQYTHVEVLLLQVQRNGNSCIYAQIYCSSFQAGEKSPGQNQVYLSDVCEVF